jgi:hypothetical protein
MHADTWHASLKVIRDDFVPLATAVLGLASRAKTLQLQ